MRIREYQKSIQENEDKLTSSYRYDSNAITVNNYTDFSNALHYFELNNIGKPYFDSLRNTGIFNHSQLSLTIAQPTAAQIHNLINQILASINIVKEVIKNSFHFTEIDENVISIKFLKLKNFAELESYLEKLKKAIDLPVGEFKEGGEVKILNFDSGTFWIDILLPTSASVLLIGSIAWAGAVIFKKYQEAFLFKSYAESVEIKKEHLKALAEAADKKIQLDIEAEAKLIQNEFFDPNDNDQLGRLKLSIKEYSELIAKGVEIQPSLLAPENVSNLFPNYKAIDLVVSKVKELAAPASV
jgi:hypothetical protein